MGNLGDILKLKIEKMGIKKQVEAVDIVEKANSVVSKIVSEQDFEIISYNKGVLKIKAENKSCASDLLLSSKKITDEIREIEKIKII